MSQSPNPRINRGLPRSPLAMTHLARVACVAVVAVVLWTLIGHPVARAGDEVVRIFPTHQGHPEKTGPGFVVFGLGRVDVGMHSVQKFEWWGAAEARTTGPDAGEPCFRLAVIGPLMRGVRFGQSGEAGCLEGTASGVREVAISAPLRSSRLWNEFDVGVAAYESSVESIRLIFSGGQAMVVPTRQIGHDLSVPGLGSLHYAVFAVSGCIKRVEAEQAGQVTTVTKLSECRR